MQLSCCEGRACCKAFAGPAFALMIWRRFHHLQDLNKALDRIRSGEPIESVLTPPQPVQSHVLDDDMDSEDEDEQNGKVEERAAEHKAVS